MFEKLRELIRRWLGIKLPSEPAPVEEFTRQYEDIRSENITAIIAEKLSTLTFADSTLEISDGTDGKDLPARVQLVKDILDRLWAQDCDWITAQALGKGGKVLVPTVNNGMIHINVIDQSRMRIMEMASERITSAMLQVDTAFYNERRYDLIAHYTLDGNTQVITYRIVSDSSSDVSIGSIPIWAEIEPEITITNTDRLLFAFLRSPRDNRRDIKRYGVPITYGAERLLEELAEHANTYRREFKLTRPMLGLDAQLWKQGFDGTAAAIDNVRKTVQDGDDPFVPMESTSVDGKGPWQYYAPEIRQSAMEQRYQSLCRRVEKACGLSQGILTERQTMNYANRDEVRAAQYDTFSVVKSVRDTWERVFDDLVYAIDVLAERFGLTPAGARGQVVLAFDWDHSLIESTAETFSQMSELQSRNLIGGAELRQWVMGGTLEDSKAALAEIAEETAQSSSMLRVLRDEE